MRTSESVATLAAALAAAQGQYAAIGKDGTADTGTYKYRYITLGALIASVRKPLATNGLAVVQVVDHEGGQTMLTSRLFHSSGEWIEAAWPLPHYDKPQAQGSVITYWRRYQLQSLLGIAADEDDDGQAAQVDKPSPVERLTPPPTNGNLEAAIVTATAEVMSHKTTLKEWAPQVKTVKQAREAVLALVRDVAESTGETEPKKLAEDSLALMAQLAAGRAAEATQ